jgi:hypothetical protein
MTAFANITLNDGQATPVAHTFTARRILNNVAKWQDLSSGYAVGFPTVEATLREPVPGSKIPCYKCTININAPKLETVNASTYSGITPAPTKAYDVLAKVEFILPERSALQDRKDILAYCANALAQADLKAMVQDLNMVY